MLDIHPVMLFLTMAIFIIMLIVLNKILYKPMLSFIDKRKEGVKSDQDKIEQNLKEAAKLEEEAMEILLQAKTDALKEKTQIVEKVKHMYQTSINTRKRELENDYDVFLNNLQEERKGLKDSLLSQMPLYKDGLQNKLSKI